MASQNDDQQKVVLPQAVRQPKAKVQRPKLLDELCHQTRQKRSIYYFTTGRKINDKKYEMLITKKNPFELPSVDNLFKQRAIEKEIREEERKADRMKKVHDKHTYRTRQMLDLSERLYVPTDEEKATEGIVDIDKQFFTITKGRPLKEKRFDLRKYVQNVKDGFRARLKVGFLYDEIYLIERQQYTETKTIEGIRQNLQEYTNSFDEFLAKDNDRSMTLLRESSEEMNRTSEKKEDLNATLKRFTKLKCEMYDLEEIWAKGNACKNFLYEVSPMMWKKKYEKELAKTSVKKEDMKKDLTASLESLLEPFIKETETECPPLYFTKPWQLRYIFREMELKNQNALLFLQSLRTPNEIAELCLQATRDYYVKEITKIEENLLEMEKHILEEEKRAVKLKETANKFINGIYKKTVSGEKGVLLHAHVQNAYEACITPDGSKLSILEMLRDLEIEYKRLLLELDKLPLECVKEAKYFVKEDTAYIFGEAKQARKNINYLDILIRRMISALEPPLLKTTRPLVFRSEPPPYVPKPPPPIIEKSAEELEYIHFFTDKLQNDQIDDSKLFFPLGY